MMSFINEDETPLKPVEEGLGEGEPNEEPEVDFFYRYGKIEENPSEEDEV